MLEKSRFAKVSHYTVYQNFQLSSIFIPPRYYIKLQICTYVLGLQQMLDSLKYLLEIRYSDSIIDIWYLFARVLYSAQ